MRAHLRRLIGSAISRWRANTYPRWRERRAARREPHEVVFFYDVRDAYSHLVAQCLPALARAYDVAINAYIVSPPGKDMAPERAYLDAWAVRDACDIAPFYGLRAPLRKQPSQTLERLALSALAASGLRLVEVLPDISAALWHGKRATLQASATASPYAVTAMLETGDARRARAGHYLGGMLYYRSTWYWGIDRLPYLLARLAPYKRAEAPDVFAHTPPRLRSDWPAPKTSHAAKMRLECFLSLRSPYSYLAMGDLLELKKRYGVEIVPRPVLPMVMRGLPVPARKGLYILEDAAREARTHNIPFGKIIDPVGTPVRRGMSLFPYADAQGLGLEWLQAFCIMAWSQGRDMQRTANLRQAAEHIGLDWQKAKTHLDSTTWEKPAEANQSALFDCKLWGVPSFRLYNQRGKAIYTAWGRDRIWRLACILADSSSA